MGPSSEMLRVVGVHSFPLNTHPANCKDLGNLLGPNLSPTTTLRYGAMPFRPRPDTSFDQLSDGFCNLTKKSLVQYFIAHIRDLGDRARGINVVDL